MGGFGATGTTCIWVCPVTGKAADTIRRAATVQRRTRIVRAKARMDSLKKLAWSAGTNSCFIVIISALDPARNVIHECTSDMRFNLGKHVSSPRE
jgi:hypothetical protein